MANPTRADVHIDVAATNISVAYRNQTYIADQVMPNVPVAKQTGKYFVFDKPSWFRDEADVRAPGTRAPLVEYSMSTPGTYACIEYSAAYRLPDEIRENADDPLKPERTAVELVTDKILLARERRVASLLFSTDTFSGYTATAAGLTGGAGVAWSTYETSNPVQDVTVMVHNVMDSIGFKPNILVMGNDVYKALKVHPVILDYVKYTQVPVVTTQLLASLFDVEKVLVGSALYTATAEGATASYSKIWGSYVLVAYVTPRPALESPSLGYMLTWKNRRINRYREDQEHSDKFECLEDGDEVVCSAQSGYLLSSVVS